MANSSTATVVKKQCSTKDLIKMLDNLLCESKDNQKQCLKIIDEINRRPQLINFIKTFIGKDGFISFEHGYKPKIYYDKSNLIGYDFRKVYGIGYDFIAMPKQRISIEKLTKEQLKIVCKILYEYSYYCRYIA